MRRAGRWLFNFALSLSLLLCLTTVVLWVRSYNGCDAIGFGAGTWYAQMFTQHGELVTLTEWDLTSTMRTGFRYQDEQIAPFGYTIKPTERGPAEWAGFRVQPFDPGMGLGSCERTMPFWFVVIVTAVVPIYAAVGRRPKARFINFAAVVSGAMCIVLVVLGIRSFWKVGSLVIDHQAETFFWVEVEHGRLGVWKQRLVAPATQPARLLAIQSGENMASVRPKNVITSSVLGFGAEFVSRAPFDASVANLAKMRLDADKNRDLADAADEALRQAQAQGRPPRQIPAQQSGSYLRWLSRNSQQAADKLATERHTQWQVTAPIWGPLLCLIWIPYLVMAKTWRLYKRKKLGLCLACGYDLRATPDRCPECGTIPEGAKGVAT